MNTKTKYPMKKMMHAVLPLFLATTSAQAADTDVYLNQSSTVKPNVIFSMDTSGSMQYQKIGSTWYYTDAPPAYSPTTDYGSVFDDSQFYISTDGRIPTTATGIATAPLQSLEGCDFSVSPMATDGFTAIRAAIAIAESSSLPLPKDIWLPSNKVYFDTTSTSEISIECSDDSGIHGAASGGGGSYASASTSGGSLYTSSSTQEIDWNSYPFVTLYSGRYLNYKINPPANVRMARGELQNRVIRDAIKRTPDIMAGLARMYGVRGGGILRGVKDNSIRANQDELLAEPVLDTDQIDSVYAGATPLSTLLLEIMHYYHGKQINRSPDYYHGGSTPSNWTNGYTGQRYFNTDTDVRTGGTYDSPIEFECQKSYVILVTDGEPSWDDGAYDDFKASNSLYPDYATYTNRSYCNGNCLDEVSGYMSEADASPLADTYDLDGDGTPDPQTVKVYPIGMETQQDLLDDAAAAAGTESYYASNATEFENAFVEILANIKESGGVSMVTAASSNDRFSKTSNRDFLYYGQFVPSNNFQWQGNLKKYRYAYTSAGVAYITDSDTTANVDITTADGSIVNSAKSYWSSSADGNDALTGGVVDRLKTRGATGRVIRGINNWDDTEVPIMTSENVLSTDNATYNSEVNADDRTASERTNILNYALGQDVKDEDEDGNTSEQRGSIGAIVRSSPVAIQYGGTSASPEIVVFATTTDGVLHAFDDESGDELWAIVMPEAYSQLAGQYDNYFSTTPWWGVDGSISSRVIDNNNNGIIETANDDKVYLYISGGMSMRRWFMLDVTNATASSNQVTLTRRGKYDKDDSNWDELGIATAQMVPMTYRLDGDATGVYNKAMIYANGWDPMAEFNYLTENTMGRGISVYDADSGSPLWQMTKNHGASNMAYAFATQPTTVDLDGDGFTDLIYAVDVNARLWRFNVKNGASNMSSLIDGDILAELGTITDTVSNQRRTYKRVDAAVVNTGTDTEVFLAIGTGDRMNPMAETVQDRLHVVRDKTAASGTNPTAVLNESDFYDATDNVIGEGSDLAKQTALSTLNSLSGWYIDLPFGEEKAISAPLISSGIANFSVYKVGGTSTNPCEDSSMGSGLLYRVNVLDATPATDHDGNGNLTAGDRFTQIRGLGIPGDVGFHTSSSGVKTIIVNRDPFINRPDPADPSKNAEPNNDFHGDSAGYWFE